MAIGGRGQTTIFTPPGSPPPSSSAPGWSGCLVPLVFLVLLTICHDDKPSSYSSYSGLSFPYLSAMGAPPSPPPPQFAALTQKDRQKRTAPQAFVFEDGKIEIVRVRRKSDIPTDEAAAATIIKPGSHGGVSKVTQPGVYIFYGDIDVHVGDLDEYDEWSARFESQGGDIQKAVSELSVESARGPPSTRKVYVIGRITSVVGPDLHGMSSAHVIAIDLSVRAERQRQYEQQQSAYDAKKEEYHQAQERAREAAERAARESYEHPVEHPIEVP